MTSIFWLFWRCIHTFWTFWKTRVPKKTIKIVAQTTHQTKRLALVRQNGTSISRLIGSVIKPGYRARHNGTAWIFGEEEVLLIRKRSFRQKKDVEDRVKKRFIMQQILWVVIIYWQIFCIVLTTRNYIYITSKIPGYAG